MKPAAAVTRSLWIKLKLLLAMAYGEATARRDCKRDQRPSRQRTRTFFEMP